MPDPASFWYEELWNQYKPTDLRVLMIGESPPDPRAADRRFFYAPTLTRYDNLYRGVAQALYGLAPTFDVRHKSVVLRRLQHNGVWLIDAVTHPVNTRTKAERREAIRLSSPEVVDQCQELAPSVGVLICHTLVFDVLTEKLRKARVAVLHGRPFRSHWATIAPGSWTVPVPP